MTIGRNLTYLFTAYYIHPVEAPSAPVVPEEIPQLVPEKVLFECASAQEPILFSSSAQALKATNEPTEETKERDEQRKRYWEARLMKGQVKRK